MAIFPSTIDDRTTAIENPASQSNAFTLSIGMASKRGPRDKNEDAAGVSPCHTFFAIADGIGGAPLGDIMSTAACNAAIDSFTKSADIEKAFRIANNTLIELKNLLWMHNPAAENLTPVTTTPSSAPRDEGARRAFPTSGAGSTLMLAAHDNDRLELLWVGDTIALLLRDGHLDVVAPPDNVNGTNELGSAAGYDPSEQPHHCTLDLMANDLIVLCTDGVWGELPPERLRALLTTPASAPWIAQLLTKEAVKDGHDNATAIVMFVNEPDGAGEEDKRDQSLQDVLAPIACTPSYPAINYR